MNKLPTLYGADKNKGYKTWSVFTEEDTITVTHGKLDGKLQTKTTVCKGKNIGRANATTDEEQAISEAQSKWNKQKDKYYRETLEEVDTLSTEGVMLAQDYTKKPNFLEDSFYASRKLDGLRCKSVYKDGVLTWNSRGGKTYPVPPHLVEPLTHLHKVSGLEQLDGECYVHGFKLQSIQSAVKKHNTLTSSLTYEIFDIPLENVKWVDRLGVLTNLEQYTNSMTHVNIVENIKSTKEDLQKLITQFISEGFEGVMLRNAKKGDYAFQNKRSNDLLKYKLFEDSECKILSCVEDKNAQGKFTVGWTNPNGVYVEFELSMNGDQDENAYTNLKNKIGAFVNFKYQDLTIDGKPSFARGLYFRECTEGGIPLE